MFSARVQREDFDPAREAEALTPLGAGALVTFLGFCRDEGGRLRGLELEHYPGMAESEISAIIGAAAARWPLLAANVVHRTGEVRAGERIVFVGVAAEHRGEAFAAAAFMMDFLKTKAPFWKRELRSDGSAGPWVAAKQEDEASRDAWAV